MLLCPQTRLQLEAAPVRVSRVQALLSSQVAGQFPSQTSGASTVPLPQEAEQSLSEVALQPAGQQPSPLLQTEIAWFEHTRLQLLALPVRVSMVQALLSLQVAGQLPSQVSPWSTWPLPQVAEQSLSVAGLQPGGQHPSPPVQTPTGWCEQARLQVEALPVWASEVQAIPSSQLAGQSPSQVSRGSTLPLPQVAEQSLSPGALQPEGQQPSPETQVVVLS